MTPIFAGFVLLSGLSKFVRFLNLRDMEEPTPAPIVNRSVWFFRPVSNKETFIPDATVRWKVEPHAEFPPYEWAIWRVVGSRNGVVKLIYDEKASRKEHEKTIKLKLGCP